MSFKPSVFQQGIYDFISNGNGNAVVSAVAGSGKTTTLLNALKLIPNNKRILFLAFNKSIAKEIQERVPNLPNIDVKTVHGFGYSSLLKDYSIEIFSGKYNSLCRDIYSFIQSGDLDSVKNYSFSTDDMKLIYEMEVDWTSEEIDNKQSYLSRVIQLCDLGRLNLINTDNRDTGIDELNIIAKKHNVELVNGECFRAWNLIKLGMSYFGKMDFTDMIFLPIKFGVAVKQYDIVFIDECQDLNSCQRELMQKAIKPNTGRFVAVGDPAQAIYGFAGADSDSFKKLCNIPNTIQLPLSVCYRCGKNIIDKAKKIISHIEAFDGAKDGEVKDDCKLADISDSDMVLCRQTYPLVRLCLKFLSEGKKARIMGGDIGRSLIKMIEDTKSNREEWTIENMFNRLYADLEKVKKNIMRKEGLTDSEAEDTQTYSTAKEKLSVIEMLSKNADVPNDVIGKIDNIFSDDNKDGIILSTIHKSKGLEANNVYIIHPELMPSKYAEQDWEIEQENNLRYVAYTRAKNILGFISKNNFDAWNDSDSESRANSIKEIITSNWVGVVGEREPIECEIILIKEISNNWGDDFLYEMKDKKGNLFCKFGQINNRFIVSEHQEVEVGSRVRFLAKIKKHREFNNEKITDISTLAKL
jgi:DNA helicase II / ATP-dependent DNA helicase PcrA